MPDFVRVNRDHVFQALDEFDLMGEDAMLVKYGFRPARDHLVLVMDRAYPSKAILGAAYGYATGTPARWDEVRGGVTGAARWLRELGFEIVAPLRLTEAAPRHGSWQEANALGHDRATPTWAEAAYDALVEVATAYRATISTKELAEKIQWFTGVRTSQLLHQWVGDVLAAVATTCAQRSEPLLSALCVDAQGRVGAGYPAAAAAAGVSVSGDADRHAAQQRLECYRRWATDLPEDGGAVADSPSPRVRPVAKRSAGATGAPRPRASTQLTDGATRPRPSAAQLAAAPPVRTCPSCNTAVPSTGVCDYCD